MVVTLSDRAQGCLLGLAIGDALGSPGEGKTPRQIREQWGRITDFLSEGQAGTDDTEFAIFSAKLVLKYGIDMTAAQVAKEWKDNIISRENYYKGAGFSEMLTVKNLKKGLKPPYSGQHLHSWSDGLAMRVAPYGIVAAGNPGLAARLAAVDGSVSHSGEGILSGQLVAAAVSLAMKGKSINTVITSALDTIPLYSWTARAVSEAVTIASSTGNVWECLEKMYEKIVCSSYFWSDMAPEAVGLAMGILAATGGDFEEAVIAAVNIGRDTDTIAAIAGAISGAHHGIKAIPDKWRNRIGPLQGNCIKTVAGTSVYKIAENLITLAENGQKTIG